MRSLCLTILALLALCGCQADRRSQLERVAKDWCETIRASQVIPVYPLTEDLQPGDVFLVQTPVTRQEEAYREKGFLPLDQLATRLHDLEYASFYRSGFFAGDFAETPHARPWLESPESPPSTDAASEADDGSRTRWLDAPLPMAAFPSYSFEVSSGAGLQIALPVQGVPVGLGLMQTNRALGTITISEGFTYAIDTEAALRRLRVWADRPEVRRELAGMARQAPEDLYLRTVTRVYFVGAIDMLLQDARSGGAGLEAGAASPLNLPDLSESDPEKLKSAAVAYREALAAISGVASTAPGGSFQVAFASQRSVGLSETFPRPLAIGYLGFDVLVDEDGHIGAPVATREVLDPKLRARPLAADVPFDVVVKFLPTIHTSLKEIPNDPEADELAQRLDDAAPALVEDRVPPVAYDWEKNTTTLRITEPPGLTPPDDPKFTSAHAQWSRNRDYLAALNSALAAPAEELRLIINDGAARPATDEDLADLRSARHEYQQALAEFEWQLRTHPDILAAVAGFNERFVDTPQ